MLRNVVWRRKRYTPCQQRCTYTKDAILDESATHTIATNGAGVEVESGFINSMGPGTFVLTTLTLGTLLCGAFGAVGTYSLKRYFEVETISEFSRELKKVIKPRSDAMKQKFQPIRDMLVPPSKGETSEEVEMSKSLEDTISKGLEELFAPKPKKKRNANLQVESTTANGGEKS